MTAPEQLLPVAHAFTDAALARQLRLIRDEPRAQSRAMRAALLTEAADRLDRATTNTTDRKEAGQ